jgi:serine/threonine protein kinase
VTQKAHAVGELVGGRYLIRAVVGKRPLGMMYRAFDKEVEIEVALRVIAPELIPDEAARQAFAQRMGRARGLQHPNLMRFHGIAVEEQEVAVAVQWAPGPALRDQIAQKGMAISEARPILAQVAAGLQHAHSQGLVFGDVRPETVIVYADGIKLSNIGIGLALPRRAFLEAMQGTPAFAHLAPELRAGRVAEPRADVFSLATLTIELLTGQMTQPGQRIALAALAQLPPALGPTLSRALAEDPMLRQATVEALGREIDVILSTGAAPRPRRQTLPPASGETEGTEPDAKPRGFAQTSTPETSENSEETRQVTEDELQKIQGREVTRRVHEDELFALRVQSSDIHAGEDLEIEMEADYEVPEEAVKTHDENERDTERVLLLEPDAIKTEPVAKIDPPAEPEAEPNEDGEDGETDPDDDLETIRVEKLAPEEIAKPMNGVVSPPAPREVVVPPKAPPPVIDLPKIEVTELPVERPPPPPPVPPFAPPPPVMRPPAPAPPSPAVPRAPTPARGVPRAPTPAQGTPRIPTPARGTPRAPTPPRGIPSVVPQLMPRHSPTQEVAPIAQAARPAAKSRRGVIYGLLVIVAFAAVLTAIVLGIADHLREINLSRERAAKQRLADELNAQAEALRRASTNTKVPPGNVARPEPVPIVPVAVPFNNKCPLGANLVEGTQRYCIDVYEYPGGKTIPRTEVSYEEAGRLCASRGERLCSEQEWERACRGKSGASYPYGQAFDPTRCNTRGSGGEIAPAGSFATCRSASGAYDMSGNVAEWVTGGHGAAQKGGSVLSTNPQVRCSHVVRGQPEEGGVYVGFRCCSDPK